MEPYKKGTRVKIIYRIPVGQNREFFEEKGYDIGDICRVNKIVFQGQDTVVYRISKAGHEPTTMREMEITKMSNCVSDCCEDDRECPLRVKPT